MAIHFLPVLTLARPRSQAASRTLHPWPGALHSETECPECLRSLAEYRHAASSSALASQLTLQPRRESTREIIAHVFGPAGSSRSFVWPRIRPQALALTASPTNSRVPIWSEASYLSPWLCPPRQFFHLLYCGITQRESLRPKTSLWAVLQSLPNIGAGKSDMWSCGPGGSLLICSAPPLCAALPSSSPQCYPWESLRRKTSPWAMLQSLRNTAALSWSALGLGCVLPCFASICRALSCSWGLCTTVCVSSLIFLSRHSLSGCPLTFWGHAL